MGTREYLGFIAILEQARASIKEVLDDHSNPPDTASSLTRTVADLEKAIQAYRDKLKARRR
jgi:hypothetical protein